jgi:hypothetical protein
MGERCPVCGLVLYVPREEFNRWFMQRPPGRFVTLAEFLAPYCKCPRP